MPMYSPSASRDSSSFDCLCVDSVVASLGSRFSELSIVAPHRVCSAVANNSLGRGATTRIVSSMDTYAVSGCWYAVSPCAPSRNSPREVGLCRSPGIAQSCAVDDRPAATFQPGAYSVEKSLTLGTRRTSRTQPAHTLFADRDHQLRDHEHDRDSAKEDSRTEIRIGWQYDLLL
jgi:hypothetical protein